MIGEHHLWSRYFVPTLREEPSDAELASHRLMLRAGLMRRIAHGIFDYLPLGVRVIHKVERIIREELNAIGAQEVLLPVLSPAELWKESGRWTVYGKEMMRLVDRHEREYALGPTHEEVITALVRGEVRSYRQLPLTLYQIQTKFRDEVRPRFGVMRGREFLMKDAYSFHDSQESLDETYRAMHDAYARIFRRCGLETVAVEAAGGAIGGSVTHEFTVLAESGESEILSSPCGYAANTERAEMAQENGRTAEAELPISRVHTPDVMRVEDVSTFLGVPASRLVKTLLFEAGGEIVAVLVSGDREVNEEKVKAAVGRADVELASAETIERVTGAPVGFSGPVGLRNVHIVADRTLREARNVVVGANAADHHLMNANPGRDFRIDSYADLVSVRAGDPCPRCGEPLTASRGIEVGQIFQLGTKYSVSMNATFQDASGHERPYIMGCYGIGVTRTIAAAIEQNHDVHGVRWPAPLAPFDVHLLPVNVSDARVQELSDAAREALRGAGFSILEDDRNERAGVKFKDADLIGLPVRATIGERAVKSGAIEARSRRTGETRSVPAGALPQAVRDILQEAS
jgi:prolyl-tRNA synthetase